MKILGTIVLTFVVIIGSLVVLLSSVCAFDSGFGAGGRLSFAFIAVVAIAAVIASVSAIARINRNP